MLIIPSVILAIEDESDRDFMEQVYRQYHRLMYHTIYQLTDDPWLADDVLQITLVKLIDNIPTLRSLSNTKRINYIISAVKNSTYTQLRKTKNHPEIDIGEWMMKNTLTAEDDPELLAIHKEEIRAFSQIWPKLDDKNRLLLLQCQQAGGARQPGVLFSYSRLSYNGREIGLTRLLMD